jgi:phage terminase large subunit
VGVNVGDSPTDRGWPDGKTAKEKFKNYKAELWWTMRERFLRAYEHLQWLKNPEEGKQHPEEDLIAIPREARELVMQLSQPKADYSETGKIEIEGKKALERRGIKSPDYAEALMLTFATNRQGAEVRRPRW